MFQTNVGLAGNCGLDGEIHVHFVFQDASSSIVLVAHLVLEYNNSKIAVW